MHRRRRQIVVVAVVAVCPAHLLQIAPRIVDRAVTRIASSSCTQLKQAASVATAIHIVASLGSVILVPW